MVFSTTFSRDFMRLNWKVDAHSISILVVLKDLNIYSLKQAGNSLKSRMGSEQKWSCNRIFFSTKYFTNLYFSLCSLQYRNYLEVFLKLYLFIYLIIYRGFRRTLFSLLYPNFCKGPSLNYDPPTLPPETT